MAYEKHSTVFLIKNCLSRFILKVIDYYVTINNRFKYN